ncbi:hypothetical protein D3C80_1777350 [compost metagenome]
MFNNAIPGVVPPLAFVTDTISPVLVIIVFSATDVEIDITVPAAIVPPVLFLQVTYCSWSLYTPEVL